MSDIQNCFTMQRVENRGGATDGSSILTDSAMRGRRFNRQKVMAISDIDRTLLDRCLRGKSRAWEDFVGRFAGLVVYTVDHVAHTRGLLFSQADRDDLVAEVFLEILRNRMQILRQFRGRSSLATYLSVVARRTILRRLAAHRNLTRNAHSDARSQESAGSDDGDPDPVGELSDQSDFTQQLEDREMVGYLLAQLPPEESQIVRMYHLESRSYSEIAQTLQISENSVGPILFRAKEKLRRLVHHEAIL